MLLPDANGYFLRPPPGKIGDARALVLIQGAASPPEGYRPIVEKIQAGVSFPLWVGVPEFLFNTPEPGRLFRAKIDGTLHTMRSAGMAASKMAILAHSLGGIFAQQHIISSNASECDALVIYGSTLLRKYRLEPPLLSTPLLTLDGTLDGLLRITRQAEAKWHEQRSNSTLHRVVLLSGLNHWSISSGPAPANVREHDLPAEVSESQGHTAIAKAVAAFLTSHFADEAQERAAAEVALETASHTTREIVAPLIKALEKEGNRHLHPPCNSDYPTNPTCEYPRWPRASLGPPRPPARLHGASRGCRETRRA